MRRWREDEGRDEGRAGGARVRSVGLGLGSKWAGLVCGLMGNQRKEVKKRRVVWTGKKKRFEFISNGMV